MFPGLWHEIQANIKNDEDINDATKKILSTKRYPRDQDLTEILQKSKVYDNSSGRVKLCFVLESINQHLSSGTGGFTVLTGKPTIEHILPQNPDSDWKEKLGMDFERIYETYLNTLGNLTIVTSEWNSSLSNRPFQQKKEMLSVHALKINCDYFSQDIKNWDEAAISKRMMFLLENIIEIWPSFDYSNSPKNTYSNKPPMVVVIRGDQVKLSESTWRQLKISVVEWGIVNFPHLFKIASSELSTHFCEDPDQDDTTKQWQKLSNSFYLSINYSAKDHIRFCYNFLRILGVTDSEWFYKDSI